MREDWVEIALGKVCEYSKGKKPKMLVKEYSKNSPFPYINIKAFDNTSDENFKTWIFKQNAGQHNRFSQEQMDWIRMIKDHVVSSYHIEMEDLDYTPFNAKGGRGKMYQLFGKEMDEIIDELNEVLAA